MIAAIYARKSTDQNVADEEKSVTRQIDHARAFAASKGWATSTELIFVDDGISGAIFDDGRPGLARLLNALKPRPAFDVIILSEVSRIGREQTQTGHVFGLIHRAGVQVFSYLDDRQILLETAIDKVMLNLTAFAAEIEREKARQRTRDAMLRKARAGHVTGGRVFGYDNVRVDGHVERRINDREAAVIRRMFELAALGHGLRVIAHTINAERLPAPRPQRGRPMGWAPSSVRDVLARPIYRGIIEYDRVRRNNERKQLKRNANAEPIRVEAPNLRIVDADLAAAVDAQRLDRRERYIRKTDGKLLGRPAPKAIKHVLSGLLRCACGASFEAQGASYGRRKGGVYVCSAARRKGRAVCASEVHLPAAETERRILDAVERQLLDANLFGDVLDVAVERLTREAPERGALSTERERLDRELCNLGLAVANGGDVPTIVAEIRKRETRKAEIDRVLTRPVVDRDGLRRALEAKLEEWKRLLRSRPTHGQTVLRHLLDGPITIGAPKGDSVTWEAQPDPWGVLGGILSTKLASPTGFEPVFWP